ncbi:hypothetical protein HHI36_018107 [Cryptolaemus montrouzieri]|uniref:DUF1963 domain-containing protein n=1 Tax=Cryptolaemus montrouzieri TaxID=559131 RepID=A0ABD2NZA0_9CUCU
MEIPQIPEKFFQYAEDIKATMKDTVRFKLKAAKDLKIWQSKVGGIPYLPIEEKYPCNNNGIPLQFLLQINFSETPCLPGFPENGILEFYIDANDEFMGLNFDNPTQQNGFRVLYFNSVDEDESKLNTDIEAIVSHVNFNGPISEGLQFSLDFSLEKQYITGYDYRFSKIIPAVEDNFDMIDEYNDAFPHRGHRLGGYPYFTQTDPREDAPNFHDHELLLQLDSDYFDNNDAVLWGDAGVGAFFIKPDDLIKCDFSNVIYNWDCC